MSGIFSFVDWFPVDFLLPALHRFVFVAHRSWDCPTQMACLRDDSSWMGADGLPLLYAPEYWSELPLVPIESLKPALVEARLAFFENASSWGSSV